MKARRIPALLALCLAASCNHGGQTGEESGFECPAELSVLDLDAVSPLGFSAREALTLAEGEHVAPFEWIASSAYPYGPESGASSVRVTVTSNGAARFARITSNREVLNCRDHLELPVTVTLSTAGGAFAERFNATLVANEVGRSTLSYGLPEKAVSGAFALDRGEAFKRVEVTLDFAPGAFSGSLQVLIERSAGDAVSALTQPLACWGTPSDSMWWCTP